jgi:ADP-ribose pyrophosphatase YjhB (NUDIX family)
MKENLIAQIQRYIPVNEQEETDKKTLLEWLNHPEDISVRENLTGHLTASAWVVSPDRKQVLMAYHKLYDSWAWLGGHADGDWNLLRVAEKEAREESGIETVTQVSAEPISLEILTVNGHEKKGRYVPCHLHLNLTYLFEASSEQHLQCKPDENTGVAWLDMDNLGEKCNEPWFVERIYSKLVNKAKQM